MTSLIQGNMTMEVFYQAVYRNLSLILNKLGSMEVSSEAANLLTQTYRDKALDTFIRGLNGDMPRLLGMKEPVDLPQALHLCLRLENQRYRTRYAHSNNQNNPSHHGNAQYAPALPPRQANAGQFYPQIAYLPRAQQQVIGRPTNQNQGHNPFSNQQRMPPPRPLAPKPPEPMEVDESFRSRRINYRNRPQNNRFLGKRPPQSISDRNVRPYKEQRNFHIEGISHEDNDIDEYLTDYLEVAEENAPDEGECHEHSGVHFLE